MLTQRVNDNKSIEYIKITESLTTYDNVWITNVIFAYRGVKYKYSLSGVQRACCIEEGCENFSHLSKNQPKDIRIIMLNGKKYRVEACGSNRLACHMDGCTNYLRGYINQIPICVKHGAVVKPTPKIKCSEHSCSKYAAWGASGKCFSHSSKEYKEKYRVHSRYRYANDINFRLKNLLRKRIRGALNGKSKSVHTVELLGCTIDQFKEYLERKFLPGMDWENRHLWHIDHVKPCSSFDLSDSEQQKQCFHYSNCQPLWAEDNLRKGNKLNWQLQIITDESDDEELDDEDFDDLNGWLIDNNLKNMLSLNTECNIDFSKINFNESSIVCFECPPNIKII